jgi:ketosteroid isomerase-like protein
MSTEQNKTVVRRFITEVLQGGDLDVLDVLAAPDYVNPAMGDADLTGFRAILTQLRGGVAMHIDDLELVAEGDAGVARFRLEVTQADGEKLVARSLTYYRLADGRITVDDPFTRPDLAQMLGVAPPAA